jgi:hypothetical protein
MLIGALCFQSERNLILVLTFLVKIHCVHPNVKHYWKLHSWSDHYYSLCTFAYSLQIPRIHKLWGIHFPLHAATRGTCSVTALSLYILTEWRWSALRFSRFIPGKPHPVFELVTELVWKKKFLVTVASLIPDCLPRSLVNVLSTLSRLWVLSNRNM